MAREGYLLGFDVGSSAVKAAVLDAASGRLAASAVSPKTELAIDAPRPGWAEQDPRTWWQHVILAARECAAGCGGRWKDVRAIGVSYQMHGLVVVDRSGAPLRPSIIWCDSRAVAIGEAAFRELGEQFCREHLLNSPGNFTAAKLAWVKANEPAVFARIHKAMLPGDYVAFRMTGSIRTTPSGLSEGILWDFVADGVSDAVLRYFAIPRAMLADPLPTFSVQGELSSAAAEELGLPPGIPVSYRAGDQPNNAFSLGVLEPGQLAATAGTSGVVYGVADQPRSDPQSRVNTFVHVNHSATTRRYGVLLCVNGTGALYRWLRQALGADRTYGELNRLAGQAPVGSDGLAVLPYGNGAERTLGNRNPGASVRGLDFNRHGLPHLLRAGQEGIVFALDFGLDIMRAMGIECRTVRAAEANMFLSPLFCEAFATVTGARVELFNTDGAQGAARGAGRGAGIHASTAEAFVGLAAVKTVEPDSRLAAPYREARARYQDLLARDLAIPS